MKFYELDIGEYFALPDQSGMLLKTGDDHAEKLPSGESVLVNQDDLITPAETP
jgi:hypothetical protein